MSLFSTFNRAFEKTMSAQKYYKILNGIVSKPSNTLTGTTFTVNKELYEFLYDYSFLQQILERISSTISDVLNKSSMRINLGDENEELCKKVNEFISNINLMDVIKMDLMSMLYYGNYGYKINFKEVRVERLVGASEVLTEDEYCKNLRLVIETWNDSEDSTDFALIPYQYNPKRVEDITELQAHLDEVGDNSDAIASNYLKEHPNADKVIRYSVYKGTGVLDKVMYLLFLLYLKELLNDLLGLKDTMRPDILTARVLDDNTDEVKIVQAMNDIEALVNQGSPTAGGEATGLSMFANFQTMITSINAYLVNGIKVVPEMNNFTSISKLDIPSLIDKRRQLQSETDDLRRRILEIMGIDDSMSDNKWDAMQKNSKYLTLIEKVVDSLALFVRGTASAFIQYDSPNVKIPLSKVELDLDTTNIIFNQYSNTRSRVLNDKIDSLTRIMRTINDWRDMDCVNADAVSDYMSKIISDLDPSASKLFKSNEEMNKEKELKSEIPPEFRN